MATAAEEVVVRGVVRGGVSENSEAARSSSDLDVDKSRREADVRCRRKGKSSMRERTNTTG